MRSWRQSEVFPARLRQFSDFGFVLGIFRLVWAVAAEMAVPGIFLPTTMEMLGLDDRRGAL